MRSRARTLAAAAALAAVVGLAAAPAAQAHYDPNTTHWHYDYLNRPTFKQCSWWDSLWGCRNETRTYGPIIIKDWTW